MDRVINCDCGCWLQTLRRMYAMFKRNDDDRPFTETPNVIPDVEPPATAARSVAAIGPSIFVRGDITGDEDLLIQGRVEGTLDLPKNDLTVGPDGKVKYVRYTATRDPVIREFPAGMEEGLEPYYLAPPADVKDRKPAAIANGLVFVYDLQIAR